MTPLLTTRHFAVAALLLSTVAIVFTSPQRLSNLVAGMKSNNPPPTQQQGLVLEGVIPPRVVTATARPMQQQLTNDRILSTEDDHLDDPGCTVNRTVVPLTMDHTSLKHFCASHNLSLRPTPARLFYGIMFSFELDMLEVALHESFPLIEQFIIVESLLSHSKRRKKAYLHQIFRQKRFQPFLHKIVNGTFSMKRALKTGWEVENKQRNAVVHLARTNSTIKDGDIFLGNMDLDEVYSRETLMRFKYCEHGKQLPLGFHVVSFRYHLNCVSENVTVYRRAPIFSWHTETYTSHFNMYKRRLGKTVVALDTFNINAEIQKKKAEMAWHMSTFGNVDQIMYKLSHTPHRLMDGMNASAIAFESENCWHNSIQRTRVPNGGMEDASLPLFVRRNRCHFLRLGWLR